MIFLNSGQWEAYIRAEVFGGGLEDSDLHTLAALFVSGVEGFRLRSGGLSTVPRGF